MKEIEILNRAVNREIEVQAGIEGPQISIGMMIMTEIIDLEEIEGTLLTTGIIIREIVAMIILETIT